MIKFLTINGTRRLAGLRPVALWCVLALAPVSGGSWAVSANLCSDLRSPLAAWVPGFPQFHQHCWSSITLIMKIFLLRNHPQ